MPQSDKQVIVSGEDVYRMQRTERGLRFDKKLKDLSEKIRARDPQALAIAKGVVDYMRSLKEGAAGVQTRAGAGVAPGAVHSNTFLSNFSLMYANDEFIGERLMPIVPVEHRSDVYAVYTKRDRFNAPDDTIGPRGTVNEVSEGRTSDNYSVKDRALQNFLASETEQNQDPVFDEMMDLLDAVLAGLGMKREERIATIVNTASNYAGNTTTLSGASQWDSGAGGDPLKAIQTGVAALFSAGGQTDVVGATNIDVYNALTRHPAILDLLKYTEAGLATKRQLASIFGLTDILVGASRKDTANKGQAQAYGRIWTDNFAVLRVARRPTKRSAHFGSTFRLKTDPITTQWYDQNYGKSGGYFAKVGVSEDHKVVAGDMGYLIVDCLV